MTSLTAFPRFLQLPPEIQAMIWEVVRRDSSVAIPQDLTLEFLDTIEHQSTRFVAKIVSSHDDWLRLGTLWGWKDIACKLEKAVFSEGGIDFRRRARWIGTASKLLPSLQRAVWIEQCWISRVRAAGGVREAIPTSLDWVFWTRVERRSREMRRYLDDDEALAVYKAFQERVEEEWGGGGLGCPYRCLALWCWIKTLRGVVIEGPWKGRFEGDFPSDLAEVILSRLEGDFKVEYLSMKRAKRDWDVQENREGQEVQE